MGSPEEPKKAGKSPNSKPSAATSPPFHMAAKQESPAFSSFSSDWATSVQAYYSSGGGTPPAFFPHVWGGQHLMPPYGTPIAYSPMYAPAAVYAHPSVVPGMCYPTGELGNGKDKSVLGKSLEGEKATAGSSNDSQRSSGGSATEGSSDTRDDSPGLQDDIKKRTFKDAFLEGEASQPTACTAESVSSGKVRTPKLPVSAPGRTTLPSPATNLNIGMDIWNPPIVGVPYKVGHNAGIPPSETGANGIMADRPWIQDERELKRERRKQSNRESARRSRLRKQQECEDLARKVAELSSENTALRIELEQLQKVCKDLEVENQQITEDLNNIRCNSSSGSTKNGEDGWKAPRSSSPASSQICRETYLSGGNFELNSR